MTTYTEKLTDPRWQRKRLKIMERDGWACRNCEDDKSTLHVHHLFYYADVDPWDYDDDLLITLCEACHETETETARETKEALWLAFARHQMLNADILDVAGAIRFLPGKINTYSPDMQSCILTWILTRQNVMDSLVDLYFDVLSRNARRTTPDSQRVDHATDTVSQA